MDTPLQELSRRVTMAMRDSHGKSVAVRGGLRVIIGVMFELQGTDRGQDRGRGLLMGLKQATVF